MLFQYLLVAFYLSIYFCWKNTEHWKETLNRHYLKLQRIILFIWKKKSKQYFVCTKGLFAYNSVLTHKTVMCMGSTLVVVEMWEGGYIKIPVCEKDNYNNKNGDFISRFVHNEKIKKKKPQMLYVHAMYILK